MESKQTIKDLMEGNIKLDKIIHEFKPWISDSCTKEEIDNATFSDEVIEEYTRQNIEGDLPYLNCYFDPKRKMICRLPDKCTSYQDAINEGYKDIGGGMIHDRLH